MKVDMRDWVIGLIMITFVTIVFWIINMLVAPNGHFNLLESYGIIMILASIHNGRMFYKEMKEKKDADISE